MFLISLELLSAWVSHKLAQTQALLKDCEQQDLFYKRLVTTSSLEVAA